MVLVCTLLWRRAIGGFMSRLKSRTASFVVLLGTCFLLALLLQLTSVAEDYMGSVDPCRQLPKVLLQRWKKGRVSLAPAEEDHVVGLLKTDLSPLNEVEELLEFGDGSLHSWNLLQEVRKHRVHLACANRLYSTATLSSSYSNSRSTATKNVSRTDRSNVTVKEVTVFHRYMDAADLVRRKDEGRSDPRRPQIESNIKEMLSMQLEADHPSLAAIVVDRKNYLSNFMVDDTNKYIYCYIPKVACTQWKKIMMLTARTANKPFQNITHNEAHYDNKLPTLSNLNKYSDTDVLERLAHYTKFLVVRSPLERLMSAYQDKFLSDNYDAGPFKKNYAKGMIKEARGVDVEDGGGLLFEEFLAFISNATRKPSSFQEHWRPMYDLCHPCSIKYDFIAKFSTLEDDSNQILAQLMNGTRQRRIQFPETTKSKTPQILEKYLADLDPELLEAVKATYRTDSEMFGY